jgi:diguanylate cyclase (GGDEF)-like protein
MFKPLNINLLTGLVVAIILLGAISVVTVVVNAKNYRDLAFDFQRQYMTQLMAAESSAILARDAEYARRLGFGIQQGEGFREAFLLHDADRLAQALQSHYIATSPATIPLSTVAIYVFDARFSLFARSMRPDTGIDDTAVICPGLISKARIREAGQHIKPLHELCMHEGRPYQASVVPVGGPAPAGYLQIVDDPVPALTRLDALLKMPVQISQVDGAVLYAASGWDNDAASNNVKSGFTLTANNSRPALEIVAARNADALVLQIEETNRGVLISVVLVLLTTLVIALLIINYSFFKPLQNLRQHLRREWRGGIENGHAQTAPEIEGPVSFHALGELYDTLHDQAIRDPLTGTYNRALLEDRLLQLIAAHRRTPAAAAVLLLDMVRFKYVNDMLGHHAGDLLLKKVVERISEELRESDTLARLGGDEFIIVLPDTDAEQAAQVALKIIHSMKRQFVVLDHKIFASVVIGIALMPEHGEDADTLVRNADYAMYTAKALHQGYAIFDPSSTENINMARMSLDGVLNEDIDRNDLFLVYQPVIECSTGRVSYLEALLRWRKPDGKILLPDAFIRAAEQSGLIRQLSEWVIEVACRQLASLQQDYPGLRTGINLSMHNLHDFNLIGSIQRSLGNNRLEPESLLLEITETGVMLDPEQVTEVLQQLSALGLRLSIDDFGTGHSSLVYLKRLPVHTLKVDKSFVEDMDTDEENASIVRATIDLAHSLGLTVTAEGVETQAVFERLQGMGCDYYQGYYIAKPMGMDALRQWLANNLKTAR